MPGRSPTPVHCGCPPSLPHCRVHAASPRAVTAGGRHPSQSSLPHRPRLLVSLTCPKPCPNRRCALAVATLFGQVGHGRLSRGQGAICNLFNPTAAPSAEASSISAGRRLQLPPGVPADHTLKYSQLPRFLPSEVKSSLRENGLAHAILL